MINTTISHYRIIKPLGEGGMGQVYLAEDTNLGRLVAMKVLAAKYNADPDFLARFKREARATAKLNHPNIVMIHEIDEHDGITYIVMEYVEGESLKDLIRREKLPIPKILAIVKQVGDGLGAAHKERVVHRDIKPANILLGKTGQVKIVDFGIAKLQDTTGLTQEGRTMGTPHYMAPEQVKGEKVDTRADIFSLGVLLWEMLARQLPFNGETGYAIMFAITQKEPAPLAKFNPEVSGNLQEIISRCLQKDADRRYQNVEALQRDLHAEEQALRAGIDATQTIISDKGADIRPRRWQGRRRAMIAYAALLALSVITFLLLRGTNKEEPMAGLSIATSPAGAAIFLNGDSIGISPLENYGVAAEENLAVRLRQPGYFTFDTAIVVKTGERFRLSQSLRPATVQVAVIINPATAQVIIDDQTISPSRRANLELKVGQHRIRVLNAGYISVDEPFILQQDLNDTLRYNLVKLPGPAANAGGLSITSQPDGATITLNGAPAGKTPYQNQNLKPGRYKVVASKEGFENYSGEVTVRSGETVPLEVTLKALTVTGRLSIKSDPEGATIFLDGRELGNTPQELNNVPAGSRQIELRKKGYKEYNATVVVEAQQLRTIDARLEALRGKLQVLVLPFGTIYIDGSAQARDSNVRFMKDLLAGSYELKVTHPTFGNYKKTVNIKDGAVADIVVDFNRQLDIRVASFDETGTKPVWGEIYVDGVAQGQTPKQLKLRLGQHTIEVRRDGYTALDEAMIIDLEENREQPLKFRLRKKE